MTDGGLKKILFFFSRRFCFYQTPRALGAEGGNNQNQARRFPLLSGALVATDDIT
jgi:hypothetical protein